MKRAVFVLTITLLLIHPAFGQTVFEKADFEIWKPYSFRPYVGDWNEDGDLDIYFDKGATTLNNFSLYNNNNGVLSKDFDFFFNYYGFEYFLSDFDHDNKLQLLGLGQSAIAFNPETNSHERDVFNYNGLSSLQTYLIDYDNDADLDILNNITLHENVDGTYIRNPRNLYKLIRFSMFSPSCDFDSDGDIDFLGAGSVYLNSSGIFIERNWLKGAGFTGGAWGDYDNDGDFDLVATYRNQPTRILRNDNNVFILVYDDLSKGTFAHWGDYDNDGYLDLAVGGGSWTFIYKNTGGALAKIDSFYTGYEWDSEVLWADLDNDGLLDLMVSSDKENGSSEQTLFYFNKFNNPNTLPSVPSNLSSTVDGKQVTLSWQVGNDSETPTQSLTSNIRLGTTPGGAEIIHPLSEINPSKANYGYRRVVDYGNVYMNTSWTLNLPPGKYYWSVQTIDQAYAGSGFASERSFRIAGSTFTLAPTNFKGLYGQYGFSAGDYDSDGDLDLILAGEDENQVDDTELYNNHGGFEFASVSHDFSNRTDGTSVWGDYNNDGYIDLMMSGLGGHTAIYKNNSLGQFDGFIIPNSGTSGHSATWVDTDNDGDLDIFLNRREGFHLLRLFINDDNDSFTAKNFSSGAWNVEVCDYDNDLDNDFLLDDRPLKIFQNNGINDFTSISLGLDIVQGYLSWADYDNDGDQDFITSDWWGITKIYKNTNGSFSDSGIPFGRFDASSIDWADCNNDGYLDILLTGRKLGINNDSNLTKILINDGSSNFEEEIVLSNSEGASFWADMDNDGDVDVLFSGRRTDTGEYATELYRNDSWPNNTLPQPPTNLNVSKTGNNEVTFFWDKAQDNESPQNSLTYNLRIGTTSNGNEVMSAMAETNPIRPNFGKRFIVDNGNVGQNTSWRIIGLEQGEYYWSVQTIDQAYAGSPFADEQGFVILPEGSVEFVKSDFEIGEFLEPGWGDWDSDGDLDFYFTEGYDVYEDDKVKIYNNNSGDLSIFGVFNVGIRFKHFFLADFNHDNILNFLILGTSEGEEPAAKIYEASSNKFVNMNIDFAGITKFYDIELMDFDNDADLDILETGSWPDDPWRTKLIRNNNGTYIGDDTEFFDTETQAVYASSSSDYDNDGDIDVLLRGFPASKLYNNTGGAFEESGSSTPDASSFAWGDFDNDGDLDLVTTSNPSKVYRNDNGNLVEVIEIVLPVSKHESHWGDYDNDGDLDLAIGGTEGDNWAWIYRNDGGSLTKINSFYYDGGTGEGARMFWVDYDNDHDLDLMISWADAEYISDEKTVLYINTVSSPNTPPNKPTGLSYANSDGQIALMWDPATDTQTPQQSLSYNLRIGTTPGGSEIMHPLAETDPQAQNFGYRRVVDLGNVYMNKSWTINNLSPGKYYWSVQAIDQAYEGSPFADEQTFEVEGLAVLDNTNLPPITKGEVAWGDYDSDNDLDILLTGNNVSAIYRNDGNGAFVDFGANFPGMTDSHCAWGDYDRDGDLDVLISGLTSVSRYSRIYRNDGTKFTDIFAGLTDCSKGDVVWGDYDLDGDLDALVTGETNSGRVANLYRNDGGDNFTWVDAGFTGVSESSAAWGDYDNDGDQDLLLSGTTNGSVTGGLTHLYQNDGLGNFISVSTSLDNISSGSVSWGDFNQDGFLDVLMTGWSSGAGYPRMAKIYQNNTTGDFTNISADLEPVLYASSAWGDYDNDGDLDILLTGYELFNVGVAIIYENDNSTFKKLQDLPDLVYRGSVAWGDFDNDMDLDILVAGEVNSPNPPVTKIYYNNTANKNTKPTTPQGLDTVGGDNTIELSWSKATDNETAQNGLTYNVLIKPVILAGMQNVGGISKVTDSPEVGAQPQIGNVNHNTSISIKNLFPGIYTWQVQAVDNGFAVSDFSEPREFEADLALPVELTTFEASIQNNQAQLKWETATETNNYGFHVQRKLASATDWETLDFVQGKGTTTELQRYRYGDDISRIKYQSQEINYRLKQTDTDGSFEYSSEISVEIKPQEFRLSQNYPNPFNPTTQIEYELPQASKVVLKIYNMRGQEIRTLVDDLQNSGFKSVTWNARDNEGHKVSSGIYLYSVQMGEQRHSRKMVLIE